VTKDKKVFESLWYWSLPSHPIRKFEKCNANQGGTMETKASWWRRSQVYVFCGCSLLSFERDKIMPCFYNNLKIERAVICFFMQQNGRVKS
jgi:hypothetical protein